MGAPGGGFQGSSLQFEGSSPLYKVQGSLFSVFLLILKSAQNLILCNSNGKVIRQAIRDSFHTALFNKLHGGCERK